MNSQPKNSTICITKLIDKLQTNQVVYENVGRGGKILPESDRRQLPYTKLAKDIIKSIDKYANHTFQVEQIIKSHFYESINKADYGEFGWTEVIPHQAGNDVVLLAETYINDSQLTAKKF